VKRTVSIETLPSEVRVDDAVEMACAQDVTFVEERLRRGMSVLIQCDKELALHVYLAIRGRLRRAGGGKERVPQIVIVDGRPRADEDEGRGNLARMLTQLTAAIRGSVERTIIVLLHLDVLTTTHTSLTMEAREAIPLLYENPEAVLLGFCDPSFPLPRVIEGVFAVKREIVGIPREALAKVITQREARAIDADGFDPFALYKYVSGLNPVRLRRLLAAVGLRREALPGRSQAVQVYRELRRQTVSEDVELPNVDLERDIGGYPEVKLRLREELLDLLQRKDSLGSEGEIQALEALLPRGIIFHGPPGTGKTYFAKAMATAMDATVIIVSGPELKSKWVGESEENLRRVFRQARRSAPAVVVFDEIDAFAHARGTYQGSGVEHSMVNQLLTEMDGFRGSESVFVVGTTNFLESLDGALLRPGRFEFLIEIPAPNVQDRREIVAIYDRKLELGLPGELQEHMVRRTEGLAERERGLPFTGDHIYAVCRALKRQAIRVGERKFTPEDIDRALQRKTRAAIVLSPAEERVVAVHESGHALLAMLVEHATPPERISIAADMEGALGYVLRAARARPYAITAADMRADICVGLGGFCAERLVFGEVSIGAHTDLQQANRIARAMVEEYGMGASSGVQVLIDDPHPHPRGAAISEQRRERVDLELREILEKEYARASELLAGHRALLDALAEALLTHKVLDRAELSALTTKGSHG